KIIQSINIVAKFENIKTKYAKVILSKIVKKFLDAEKALDEFNIRRYLQVSFYDVFNIMQQFFRETDNIDDFLLVFKLIIVDWLKVLSLTIPHLCEELWELAGNKGFISTSIWGDFDQKYIDQNLEVEFEYISQVIEDIFNIKKIVNIQEINIIYLYTAPDWKYKAKSLILSTKGNFNSIISELKKEKDLMTNKQLIPYIKTQLKDKIWEKKSYILDEIKSLEDYKSYIEKRVNSSIIINSEFDPKQRAIRAKPFKPALYIDV
ncbi:MAG: class I tRNA ligase family protein, partial [Promethearchaeota archaeon]